MDEKFITQKNQERFDLISIGELSKLTNVNIKSLRYYEKIGVLLPVYVNPDSGYRYYTYSQVQLVLSIQFYVSLGIPLHTLHQFTNESTGEINFADQISYGISAARQHISDLKRQVRHAESLLEEIKRCEQLLNNQEPVSCHLPAKKCLAIPLTGAVTEQKYYTLLHQLLIEIRKAGISTKGETGIICITKNNETQTFVFSDIVTQNISKQSFSHNIRYLHFPATIYQCKPSSFVDISDKKILQQTLPEDFENGTVILTELFNKQFDYKQLLFELRWG